MMDLDGLGDVRVRPFIETLKDILSSLIAFKWELDSVAEYHASLGVMSHIGTWKTLADLECERCEHILVNKTYRSHGDRAHTSPLLMSE